MPGTSTCRSETNKKKNRKKETRDVCIRLERKWNRKSPFEMASCRVGCESNCRNPLNLWLCNSHSTCCFFGFRLAFLDAITYDIFVPPAPIDVIVFGGIVNKRHMIFLRLRQVNNDIRQKTSKFQSVDGKTGRRRRCLILHVYAAHFPGISRLWNHFPFDGQRDNAYDAIVELYVLRAFRNGRYRCWKASETKGFCEPRQRFRIFLLP